MLSSRMLKTTVISVLTMLLIISSLAPLLLDSHQAVAEIVDCSGTGDTGELAYDDGDPYGQMWTHQLSGCQQCQTFQGVLFSLPQGVASSILSKVRFYAGGGKGTVVVHIMDTKAGGFAPNELLIPKILCEVTAEKWYEIPVGDLVVPTKFWIFVEAADSLKVTVFHDHQRTGESWNGKTPYGLVSEGMKRPAGDFLIRAYIVREASVGKGEGYDYGTIQEAVDSVFDGWRISVHEGTYDENVTVAKSVTIKAVAGPDKTIVRAFLTPYATEDVFKITAGCVTLSGFTIEGAVDTGGAGVRLEDASGCVISGNVILDNNYGIYVSEDSTSNILLENECKYNVIGMYIDGSENYLSGNKLHGNSATEGSAVFLSSTASGNQLRFNTITVDPGTDPAVAAGSQVYSQSTEKVSAIENWWGTDTGPSHVSNTGGQGPAVGDTILFDPWLAKQPMRVKTVAAQAGPFILNSRNETSTVVTKEGIGRAFASVAEFAENPVGEFRYKTLGQKDIDDEEGRWIDVLFSSTVAIDEVEIVVYYTAEEVAVVKEGSLRLFWWDGQRWKKCSKTGVDKDGDFVWAKLTLKSKPAPSDLAGTMFAVGVPKGGFSWWLIPLILVLVIIALILIRLFWVLVVQRGRYPVD
ncbi:MAG: right-handed parallel beta-helix repeat-containing protein [Dehalococcoidia bacterium]|nr:right-handed parallel beta-helix repeat-containing protein [Dehalococcoidia bacterium]